MTGRGAARLSGPQLRALRRTLARHLGERFSRVRVTTRPDVDHDHEEVVVRVLGPRSDWWSTIHHAQPCGCRWVRRYIARRIHTGDLP